MAPPGILDAIIRETDGGERGLVAWGIAWARLLPTVLFVPAFGFGLLPVSLRVAMGFVLAVVIAPAVHPTAPIDTATWPLDVLFEVCRGLPVALAASVSLFAATVAGGVADAAVSSGKERALGGRFGGRTTPLGTILGFAAAILFLESGGATWIASRLVAPPSPYGPLQRAAFELAAGVGIGAAIGAPLLIVALVVDLATMIAARELPSPGNGPWMSTVRALVVLVATAVLLERMTEAIALFGAR